MGDIYPVDVPHVGVAIMAHRMSLGVELRDLIAAADTGRDLDIKFVEAAKKPSVTMIERHHAALMTAYLTAGTIPDVQVPRREQWWTTREDFALWHTVLETWPAVRWWWGIRRGEDGAGAYCYVCSGYLRTYDVGRGVTGPVRRCVMEHRHQHITDLRTSAANETKGIDA